MARTDAKFNSAQKIKIAECLRYGKSYQASISTSESIAAAIEEALPDNLAMLEIIPDGDIHIQFDGDAASAATGKIPSGKAKVIPVFKHEADNIRVFAATATSIAVYTVVTS